jgi:molecular chaperone GrpE (heat shock protein)
MILRRSDARVTLVFLRCTLSNRSGPIMERPTHEEQGKQEERGNSVRGDKERYKPSATIPQILGLVETVSRGDKNKKALERWAVSLEQPPDRFRAALLDLAETIRPYCSDFEPASAGGAAGPDANSEEATNGPQPLSQEPLPSPSATEDPHDQLANRLAPIPESTQPLKRRAWTWPWRWPASARPVGIGRSRREPRPAPRPEDPGRTSRHGFKSLRQKLFPPRSAEDPVSIPRRIEPVQGPASLIGREQVSAAEWEGRPPAEIDARALGERLLEYLAESEKTERVFARVAETFLEARCKNLELMLLGLPRLFDAVERPLEVWSVEQNLTVDQQKSRDDVLVVLREIQRVFEVWRVMHQIDLVPEPADGPHAFDQRWHVRIKSVPTEDPLLEGTIQRVIELGYCWQGERLRKADVIVYHAADEAVTGHGAAPSPPQALDQEVIAEDERA